MKVEGNYCTVYLNVYSYKTPITFTFYTDEEFNDFKLFVDGERRVDRILKHVGVSDAISNLYRGYRWPRYAKIITKTDPKACNFIMEFPEQTKDITWLKMAKGYNARFFYDSNDLEKETIITFDNLEAIERFKDAARRLMEASDGRVLVEKILELIEVDPGCDAVKEFKNYYWTPEDYWIQNPKNRLTLKFSPPTLGVNVFGRVVEKNESMDGVRYTVTAKDPYLLEKWKKSYQHLMDRGCCTSYCDEINEETKNTNTFKGGITPMNTAMFKNQNAYKTFIDKLRRNGAEIDMRMSMREFPDIVINTNTVQILRALEAIQPFDIPEIIDYKFYADRVTIVKFADGTYTKCEVQGEDKFDPDTGIIFCVVKKMLGVKGHERFNDILRKAHAAHKKVEADKQKDTEEKRDREEKAARARAKKLKREEKRKRQAIDIQKQAYVEAIAEVATKKPATRGRKKVDKE